jgi:hypothetical protein
MKKRTKILLVISGAAILAAVLLAVIAALALRRMDVRPARERIVSRISAAIGGDFAYDNALLSVFPRPRIELRGVRIFLPGVARGSVGSLSFDAAILPLLRGDFRPSRIHAEDPVFRVELAALSADEADTPFSSARLREKTSRILSLLAGNAPGAVLAVRKGRVDVATEGRGDLTFRDIEARIVFPPKVLQADLRCTSDLFESLRLSGRIDAATLDARGEVEFLRLDGAALSRILPLGSGFGIARGTANLALVLASPGLRALHADARLSAPRLDVRRGKRRLIIEGMRFEGSAGIDSGETVVEFTSLRAASPGLELSGFYRAAGKDPEFRLSLRGREIDATALRNAATVLAEDIAPLRGLFDVLRGGRITVISLETRAQEISRLADTDRMNVTGRLVEGTIRIGNTGVVFDNVRGNVSFSKGTLSADRIGATHGGLSVENGRLELRLAEAGGVPIRADLPVEADMSGVPSILSRLVRNAALDEELSRIDGLEGRAKGRVILSGGLASPKADVDLSEIRLKANYRRIPSPIAIDAGRFRYDGDSVTVRSLSGSLSGSFFTEIDAKIGIGDPRTVESFSGNLSVRLEEIIPRLADLPGMEALRRDAGAVDGRLDLRVSRLFGPLDRPSKWRLQATADGETGPETAAWFSRVVHLPFRIVPRSRIGLSGIRLTISDRESVELLGSFNVAGGPALTVDLRESGRDLEIRRITVEDADSRAAASFVLTNEELEATFSGSLADATLKRLFPDGAGLSGRIRGDFRGRISMKHPENSTAIGTLDLRDVVFPLRAGTLKVVQAAVKADGRRILVTSSECEWGKTRFSLHGHADFSSAGPRVDLDLSSDTIAWNDFAGTASGKTDGGEPGRKSPWPLPLTGTVRTEIGSFEYAGYTWAPLRATIVLEKERVTAGIDEANLCGISTPGTLSASPGGMAVDIRMSGGSPHIDDALACLGKKAFRITGTYAVSGRISGEGPADSFVHALRGNVDFRAEKGRIYKANLLMKVLALLNVTQLAFGKLPDIGQDGFAYNTISFGGTLAEGKLTIDEGIVDAASLNMAARGVIDLENDNVDLLLLASPLKTADWIIRRIPVVRYILGGRLVSLPVKVKGKTDDPNVTIHPASGITKELLGIVERTLQVPVKILEPIIR